MFKLIDPDEATLEAGTGINSTCCPGNPAHVSSFLRQLLIVAFGALAVSSIPSASAQRGQNSSREIVVNVKDARGPVDRLFDLSVGSDYPGKLFRDDSRAQLKLVTGELGFRYLRFHVSYQRRLLGLH